MELDFEDDVALVTGASSGIGRETAVALAENGATVVGFDLSREPNDDGPPFKEAVSDGIFVEGDVSDPADVARAVERARLEGPIDVVANIAGTKSQGAVGEVSLEEWRQQFAVHVEGTYNVCHEVVSQMAERGTGSIVNMGSIAALVGFKGKSDYGAAKGAVVSLTRHIAANYSPDGVRANVVAPGIIKTGRVDQLQDDTSDEAGDLGVSEMHERTLLPYLGDPEDVASSICFLASDDARFITGETLVIDGGWTAE